MKTKLLLIVALVFNSVYAFAQCIKVTVGSYSKCDTCFVFTAQPNGSGCDTTGAYNYNYQWDFTGAIPATDTGSTVTYCSQYIGISNTDSVLITMTYINIFGPQTAKYSNSLANLLPNLNVNTTLQPICIVTVDTSLNKNLIVWEQTTDATVISYNLYKETSVSGTYSLVANIPRSSFSTYTDTTSQPDVKSARYYLTTVDSCNFVSSESPASPSHKTMHLTVSSGTPPACSLVWETYDGLPSLQYRIWRNSASTGWQVIDSVSSSSTTYSDLTPPAGILSYLIEMISPTACNPSFKTSQINSVYSSSLSNVGNNNFTGINELADLSKAITIEPNPFNQFTKIDLHHFTKQNLNVVLRNLTSQVVMQFDDVKTDELIIDRNNLSQGLYFLEVTGKDFYARKKVMVD